LPDSKAKFILEFKKVKMSLEVRINDDIKTAMKAKDSVSLRGLRAIKSAIQSRRFGGQRKRRN